MSSVNPLFGNLGSNLDSEMAQAESLMQTPNTDPNAMQKQLEGQRLMEQVTQQYTAISNALKSQSDAAMTAINNSKSNG